MKLVPSKDPPSGNSNGEDIEEEELSDSEDMGDDRVQDSDKEEIDYSTSSNSVTEIPSDPLMRTQLAELRLSARASYQMFTLLRKVVRAKSDDDFSKVLNTSMFTAALEMSRIKMKIANLGRKAISIPLISKKEGNVIRDLKAEKKVKAQEKALGLFTLLNKAQAKRRVTRDMPPSASKVTQNKNIPSNNKNRGGAPGCSRKIQVFQS